MHSAAQIFGYQHYRGPLLEELDLYKAKSGEELVNEQLYSFTDRGKREVAIRPEMTPTLARMVASNHKDLPKPIRWYSIPNLMRYEKPQRGRLREHWQFNCDIFVQPDEAQILGAEFEILSLVSHLMKSFGATSEQFEIRVNDRRIVDSLLSETLKLDEETRYKVYKLIDRSEKISQEKFEKDLNEIISDESHKSILKEYLTINELSELETFSKNHLTEASTTSFLKLLTTIQGSAIEPFIIFKPSIVRGLDYYTGLVFEVFDKHPENKRAICGGGSYDKLLTIFGEDPLPATGFGLGDVTLKDFLETHGLLPDLEKDLFTLFASTQVEDPSGNIQTLISKLREENFSIVESFAPIKMRKAFQMADKNRCEFLLIAGDQELEANEVAIKDLKKKEQKQFKIDDIEGISKFLRG